MIDFIGDPMNDLVFAFNTSETNKRGSIIFESYICTNMHNKQNKYTGGRVIKVSVWDDINPENYSSKEMIQIKDFFKEKVYLITDFQYLAMPYDFYAIQELFNRDIG